EGHALVGVLFQIIGHCRIIICITGKHGIVKYQRGEASDIGRLPPPRFDIVVVGVVFHYLTAALTTTVSPFTVSETDWTSNDASSSLFVMMTGEMVLFASSFTRSISKVTSLSPTSTLSPSETKPSNPLPSIATVSRPMWISTSAPLSVLIPTAWLVGNTCIITPSTGATTSPSEGSTPNPSPIIFSAKTGSGISSSGTYEPFMGLLISRFLSTSFTFLSNKFLNLCFISCLHLLYIISYYQSNKRIYSEYPFSSIWFFGMNV